VADAANSEAPLSVVGASEP